MKIEVYGMTEKGDSHVENEDSIIINEKKGLYAVADGVTLPYGGKEASSHAVNYLTVMFEDDLIETVKKVNEKIWQDKQVNSSIGSTTLTVAHIKNSILQIAHVGDSSAYVIRTNKMMKITQDDSIPGTSMLTQVIGQNSVHVHYYKEKLLEGDKIVLATDGITNYISENEIMSIIKENSDLKEIVKRVLSYVEKKPRIYKDDKSIIIISLKK